MKKFYIEGYEITTNSDLTEGRGSSVHVAYCTSFALANEIAKGRGVMGTSASVNPIKKTIVIFDTFEEWEDASIEKIKERALAKLSEDEKNALGL